jgi:hypothetical protein
LRLLLGDHGAADGHGQGDDAVDAVSGLVLGGPEVAGGASGRRRRCRPLCVAALRDLNRTPPSPHQADDDTGAGKGRRLTAFLLLCPGHSEGTGVAHVVPGGLDPAIGTLHVRDAELVDAAIEGDRRCVSHAGRCQEDSN